MEAKRAGSGLELGMLVRLCRVHQYTKNLFIFAPLFFAARLGDATALGRVCATFASFCLLASAIYIFNDWRDLEEDRRHPRKRQRPLASGEVAPRFALSLALVLAVGGGVLATLTVPAVLPYLALYAVFNLLYSLYLKRYSLLDITLIAIGFVLRLKVGGLAAMLPLSHWIVITTFLLALFLALAKRRDDVILASEGQPTRASTEGYNEMFLSAAMAVVAAVVNVAYLMYTLSSEVIERVGSQDLYLTFFFVILGFLRYLQITFVEGRSGSPSEVVLEDRFLQVVILLWLAAFGWIIY